MQPEGDAVNIDGKESAKNKVIKGGREGSKKKYTIRNRKSMQSFKQKIKNRLHQNKRFSEKKLADVDGGEKGCNKVTLSKFGSKKKLNLGAKKKVGGMALSPLNPPKDVDTLKNKVKVAKKFKKSIKKRVLLKEPKAINP